VGGYGLGGAFGAAANGYALLDYGGGYLNPADRLGDVAAAMQEVGSGRTGWGTRQQRCMRSAVGGQAGGRCSSDADAPRWPYSRRSRYSDSELQKGGLAEGSRSYPPHPRPRCCRLHPPSSAGALFAAAALRAFQTCVIA
jgi:hypothetical protein